MKRDGHVMEFDVLENSTPSLGQIALHPAQRATGRSYLPSLRLV
jgi:hypothetical protein